MQNSLLVAGIVCMVAAVVGGGVKLLGAEVPVLSSFTRQALLFLLGLGFLAASFQVDRTKPPTPSASGAAASSSRPPSSLPPSSGPAPTPPAPPACGSNNGLACLPRSSGPVTFADPAAANRAAAQNVQDALSTSQGEAAAIRQGASGKAARLCGIIASNDSSPLGKHLAALRLNTPRPGDGQSTAACLSQAAAFF